VKSVKSCCKPRTTDSNNQCPRNFNEEVAERNASFGGDSCASAWRLFSHQYVTDVISQDMYKERVRHKIKGAFFFDMSSLS